jgi:HEAT repeat protein
VIVQPSPVVVQPVSPAPATVSHSPTTAEPPLQLLPPPRPVDPSRQKGLEVHLRQLQSADERTRAETAVELGRMQVPRAVGPLIRLLKEDPSPAVRESAARGLGLIGETNALAALQYAAQADADRDVRKSAGYAAEVIRSRLSR